MPGKPRRATVAFFLVLPLTLCSCSNGKRTLPAASSPAVAIPATAAPAQAGPRSASQPQAAAAPANASTEDQTLVAVVKALRSSKLLTRPDACYAYRFDPGAGQSAYRVEVMENHTHAECGGDPSTQPHLFTVHVNKQSRAISQDAHTPGDFQPIQP